MMNKIKTYKLFEISEYHTDSLKLDIQEYINDLHLEDDDLKMSFLINRSSLFFDLKIDFNINSIGRKYFKLIDAKDEIFRLNNFMQSFQFSITSIRWRNRYIWHNLYSLKPNRWGVKQNFNKIFDIQDCDVDSLETDLIEIIFIDNEHVKS